MVTPVSVITWWDKATHQQKIWSLWIIGMIFTAEAEKPFEALRDDTKHALIKYWEIG